MRQLSNEASQRYALSGRPSDHPACVMNVPGMMPRVYGTLDVRLEAELRGSAYPYNRKISNHVKTTDLKQGAQPQLCNPSLDSVSTRERNSVQNLVGGIQIARFEKMQVPAMIRHTQTHADFAGKDTRNFIKDMTDTNRNR